MTVIDAATDHSDTCKLLTRDRRRRLPRHQPRCDQNLLNTGAFTSIHIDRAPHIPLGDLQRFVAACLAC